MEQLAYDRLLRTLLKCRSSIVTSNVATKTITIGHTNAKVPVNSNFRVYFAISSPSCLYTEPDLASLPLQLFDLSAGQSSMCDRLLSVTLEQTAPRLSLHRASNAHDIINYKRDVHDLESRVRSAVMEQTDSLIENSEFLLNLSQVQTEIDRNISILDQAFHQKEAVSNKIQPYFLMARFLADVFSLVRRLVQIRSHYSVTLQEFTELLHDSVAALRPAESSKLSHSEIRGKISEYTSKFMLHLFGTLRDMMSPFDLQVFLFLVVQLFLRTNWETSETEERCFSVLIRSLIGSDACINNSLPLTQWSFDWLSNEKFDDPVFPPPAAVGQNPDNAMNSLDLHADNDLLSRVEMLQECCHVFKCLSSSLKSQLTEWREYFSGDPNLMCDVPLVGDFSLFQKFLLWLALCPAKLMGTVESLIQLQLASWLPSLEYETAEVRMNTLFEKSSHRRPILLITQSGLTTTWPTESILHLGRELGMDGRVLCYNAGIHDVDSLIHLIDKAMACGNWLIIENCHMIGSAWPAELIYAVNRLAEAKPTFERPLSRAATNHSMVSPASSPRISTGFDAPPASAKTISTVTVDISENFRLWLVAEFCDCSDLQIPSLILSVSKKVYIRDPVSLEERLFSCVHACISSNASEKLPETTMKSVVPILHASLKSNISQPGLDDVPFSDALLRLGNLLVSLNDNNNSSVFVNRNLAHLYSSLSFDPDSFEIVLKWIKKLQESSMGLRQTDWCAIFHEVCSINNWDSLNHSFWTQLTRHLTADGTKTHFSDSLTSLGTKLFCGLIHEFSSDHQEKLKPASAKLKAAQSKVTSLYTSINSVQIHPINISADPSSSNYDLVTPFHRYVISEIDSLIFFIRRGRRLLNDVILNVNGACHSLEDMAETSLSCDFDHEKLLFVSEHLHGFMSSGSPETISCDIRGFLRQENLLLTLQRHFSRLELNELHRSVLAVSVFPRHFTMPVQGRSVILRGLKLHGLEFNSFSHQLDISSDFSLCTDVDAFITFGFTKSKASTRVSTRATSHVSSRLNSASSRRTSQSSFSSYSFGSRLTTPNDFESKAEKVVLNVPVYSEKWSDSAVVRNLLFYLPVQLPAQFNPSVPLNRIYFSCFFQS